MATRDNPSVLKGIVSRVLALGLAEFEVEFKNPHEQVFACNGPIGMRIAAYRAGTKEARQKRAVFLAAPAAEDHRGRCRLPAAR